MTFEVWRWITLGILWSCIAGNIWAMVGYFRLRRKTRREIERYRETVGKLIVRRDEVVGLLCDHETAYIQKNVALTLRNLARRNAINEFYDDVIDRAFVATLQGVSEEYSDGYHAALEWYDEKVLKVKNEMLGDLTELSE